MGKSYKQWSPTESYLFPPALQDWLPAGHLAYFVMEFVEEADLSAIDEAFQRKDPRGEHPVSPRLIVALLLYGYCTGVYSYRRIEKATHEDVAFGLLCGGCHPHFTTLARFRREHLGALRELFVQTVRMSRSTGLLRSERVALDGTKVQANASKRKAMSYRRIKKKLTKLEQEIEQLLARAESEDRDEDTRFGAGKRGDEAVIAEVRGTDQLYLARMLDRTIRSLGRTPRSFVADAGYWSAANAELLENTGVEPYIATSRELHGLMAPATRSGPPPAELDTRARMEWRLQTEEGRERRLKRRTSNEPVFGQIKEARGFRRFHLRGLDKVRGEWSLIATAHNLLKLHKAA